MDPLINRDEYVKRVNKLANAFPFMLLAGSMVLVILYHSIGAVLQDNRASLFSFELLSTSFFQGTVITVVIYLFKSRIIGGVVRTKPTDYAQGKVQGYLPCAVGTDFRKHQIGNLIVEDHQLHLFIKKPDGYVIDTRWDDLSKVNIRLVREKYNIIMLLVYGVRDSIEITDGKKTKKIIFPQAQLTSEEIEGFIKKHIKI